MVWKIWFHEKNLSFFETNWNSKCRKKIRQILWILEMTQVLSRDFCDSCFKLDQFFLDYLRLIFSLTKARKLMKKTMNLQQSKQHFCILTISVNYSWYQKVSLFGCQIAARRQLNIEGFRSWGFGDVCNWSLALHRGLSPRLTTDLLRERRKQCLVRLASSDPRLRGSKKGVVFISQWRFEIVRARLDSPTKKIIFRPFYDFYLWNVPKIFSNIEIL